MPPLSQLITVPFRGDTLFAVRDGETVYVALKPIADRLGLDWSSQHKRLLRDELLSKGMVIMTIPSAGGSQEAVTLPLHLLPGWLFGIEARRAKPEARALILAYQAECHAALFQHFFTPRDAMPAAIDAAVREETVSVRRGLVTEARHTFGVRASASLWLTLGLPVVPEMREPSRQGAFGFTYTAVSTTPAA